MLLFARQTWWPLYWRSGHHQNWPSGQSGSLCRAADFSGGYHRM